MKEFTIACDQLGVAQIHPLSHQAAVYLAEQYNRVNSQYSWHVVEYCDPSWSEDEIIRRIKLMLCADSEYVPLSER